MKFLRVGISSVVTDKSLDLSNPHGNLPRTKNYAKDTKRIAKTPLISARTQCPFTGRPASEKFHFRKLFPPPPNYSHALTFDFSNPKNAKVPPRPIKGLPNLQA